MITAKQITDIAKQVIENHYAFDYIGLRIQDSDYGVHAGQPIEYQSRVWVDGDMMDEEVNGICAVDARQAARHELSFGGYIGNVVLVIGSNSGSSGEDDGEIILRPASGKYPVVLDIIRP